MSNSEFNAIKNELIAKSEPNSKWWKIPSDKGAAAVIIRFDEKAAPNQIALKSVDHPMRHYFKKQMSNVNEPLIAQAAAKMIHADLTSPDHGQNHYCFTINPRVTEKKFSDTAQDIISKTLVPAMMGEVLSNERQTIFVYPSDNQEKYSEWMENAFMKTAQQHGALVVPAWVQIAERKKVRGFQIAIL